MIETKLTPLFDVQLIKKNRSHFYQVTNGKVDLFPGVTGYLGIIGGSKTNALMAWAVKQALGNVKGVLIEHFGSPVPVVLGPEAIDVILDAAKRLPGKIKDAAADRGTLYHDFLDKWAKGQDISAAPPEFVEILSKLKAKLTEHGIDIIAGDTKIASPIYRYGGSLDGIGIRMGDIGVIDWKFSGGIYSEYCLQVGAYGQAFYETYGAIAKWAAIFRYDLDKKEWEVKVVRDMLTAFQGFLAAKKLKEILEQELYV